MRRTIVRKFEKLVFILEMIITIFLFVGIILGMTDFFYYLRELLNAGSSSYEMFEGFIAYALILIVGIELILMILYHSTRSILELVLFVIARKMLVYSHTMEDLVLGTLAILLVFIILRFLLPEGHKNDIVRKTDKRYFGYIRMKDIFNSWEDSHPNQADMTLNEYIHQQAQKLGFNVEEGTKINYEDSRMEVTELSDSDHQKIKEVSIYDN